MKIPSLLVLVAIWSSRVEINAFSPCLPTFSGPAQIHLYSHDDTFSDALAPTTTHDHDSMSRLSMNISAVAEELLVLCKQGDPGDAAGLLMNASDLKSDEDCYHVVIRGITQSNRPDAATFAEEVFQHGLSTGKYRSSKVYNSIILSWSESKKKEAADMCVNHLKELWEKYDATKDEKYVPLRSSYISTIVALSRSRQGKIAAEKAEELLEEMEAHRLQHPQLSPNTICVNAVLTTWRKIGMWKGSASRSEQILNRMIRLSGERPELEPDTQSLNIVLDTLAKSNENNCEYRAEELLETMDKLSSERLGERCRPDRVSYNSVINCWAQSRVKGAARRATAILKHMEQRYNSSASNVNPDATSYTTAMNAWARSRDKDAIDRAKDLLKRAEQSFEGGNTAARPNALTHNSMINCYAKSRHPGASTKAVDMLNLMKEKCQEPGFEDCHPDVVTYTSVIDTLARKRTVEAADMAEELLSELEAAHLANPKDPRMRPNIRTYTSVINAVAKSGAGPKRAKAILDKTLKKAEDGDRNSRPDTITFNAVINAFGWSKEKGRSETCFALLQEMLDLSQTGQNPTARPDIITCNSILDACTFETCSTPEEKEKVMNIVVQTLEIYQANTPLFGYPDHVTYSKVLKAMAKQMPASERRYKMAEATFWQCCSDGHVAPQVISNLVQTLSWERFSELMGSALESKEGETLRYNLHQFPDEWMRHTPQKKRQGLSRPSRKRSRGYQVTKSGLNKSKQRIS